MRRFLKNQNGFTLVELMMVIAVIGILAAFLIPKIGATKDEARLSAVDANLRQVQSQVEASVGRYRTDAATFNTQLNTTLTSMTLINPFDATKAAWVIGTTAPTTLVAGQIAVVVPATGSISSVIINSYNNASTVALLSTVTVTP